MEKKESLEKLLEIKQILDQVLTNKEEQHEILQREIENLRSIDHKISSLVAGASFTSAMDLLSKSPTADQKIPFKEDNQVINQKEVSSAQWEKYINDDSGELLAKLVYNSGTTTIIISRPQVTKLQKTTPRFQEFFIQKILIQMKEESPTLVLDFQEVKGGFIKQISISHMGSEENFAKIERAIEHVLKRVS